MIENNPCDVEIALFNLDGYGIVDKLHIARDAPEALEYLFAKDGSLRIVPPKIIFLDLHMPKISGLDLLRRFKANEQAKGIPVVVLRSSISPFEVNECQQLGVNEFLAKPFEYEEFVNIIKRY
jgi:two-component system, response regulator